MRGHELTLGGAALRALPSGALYWPEAGLLCLGDLHLGKSARLARRGGTLLPPYETEATLARMDADLDLCAPRRVICLGDSFDDGLAEAELAEPHRLWLMRMMAGRDWIWIAGNHDPGPLSLGGTHRALWREGALAFRHIAEAEEAGPEVSAHFHPKARVAGLSRPAFVTDGVRLILPAYGAYTGGLAVDAAAIVALMGPGARALLTGLPPMAVPLEAPGPKRRPAFGRVQR
ncbi:MAG: ligase-associated DNA damage response endonuclease PdeM [Gemmobacter sp.]